MSVPLESIITCPHCGYAETEIMPSVSLHSGKVSKKQFNAKNPNSDMGIAESNSIKPNPMAFNMSFLQLCGPIIRITSGVIN